MHLRTGDFAVNELASLIDIPERNALVADTYLEHGEGRRGVVFGVKVEHALHLAEAFKERGVACEAVYGEMPSDQRQDILARYANHELQMLTNVGVGLGCSRHRYYHDGETYEIKRAVCSVCRAGLEDSTEQERLPADRLCRFGETS